MFFYTHLRRFRQSVSGIAAVEFALVAPFLLALVLGGTEVTRYILAQQKVEKMAFTVADVLSQYDTLTASTVDNLLAAADDIMNPYPFQQNGFVIVSSVFKEENETNQKVRWQCSGGGQWTKTSKVGAVNDAATLPGDMLLDDRDNVIVAEVYYKYEPLLQTSVFFSPEIYKSAMFRPRLGALTSAPGC